MTIEINPPVLGKGKPYERFKQEVMAWREITEISKEKQGIVIALSLPEDDESRIREKVFDQLRLDELKGNDGLNVLINFFDQHLAKNDLTDSLEKFEDFEDFNRVEGQSINEFVAMFDSKYRKIEKKNMKLPPEILAFKLLRRANISKEEKLLVLTGMNYDNKATLYEEAKKSFKKFKGGDGELHSVESAVKFESGYLAMNQESAFVAGYRKGTDRGQELGSGTSAEWNKGANGRGQYDTRAGRNQRFDQHTNSRSMGNARKNKKPKGSDGRTLVCKSCGSFRHLLAACPDSWENMAKMNETEEEHAVLFTGYNREEVWKLGRDARNCAILDSACSSTVCGDRWMKNYIQSLDQTDKGKVRRSYSMKSFKFGDGILLQSKGEYHLPAVVAGKNVFIKTDVVDSGIPLLLSRSAMKRAAIIMDLESDTAIIMGRKVALDLTSSGHYCIPIQNTSEVKVESACIVDYMEIDRDERYRTPWRLFAKQSKMSSKSLIPNSIVKNIKPREIDAANFEECVTAKQVNETDVQVEVKHFKVYNDDQQKKKTKRMIEKNASYEAQAATSLRKMHKNWFIGRAHVTDFMTNHNRVGLVLPDIVHDGGIKYFTN